MGNNQQESPRFSRRSLPRAILGGASKQDILPMIAGVYATGQTIGLSLENQGLANPRDAVNASIATSGHNATLVGFFSAVAVIATQGISKLTPEGFPTESLDRRNVAKQATRIVLATAAISSAPSIVFCAAENIVGKDHGSTNKK